MDINQVTSELDELFAQEKIDEIPQFLESHIAQAAQQGAQDIVLTLYNETIGFYRETGQYELSIENCHKAISLMDEMGLQDTVPYATTLLNAANAHRAAGLLQESLELYNRVRPIYVAQLKEDDMYFASFYNNLSLLYQEMGDYASAKEQLENALYIVTHKPDKQFEVAVTQANLANTCIALEQDDEAKARAGEAVRMFEELGVDDAHYSAALSALGSLHYMDKEYQDALHVMEKARDCVAKYLGTDNVQYQRLSENIKIINDKMLEKAEEDAGKFENGQNPDGDTRAFETAGPESSAEPVESESANPAEPIEPESANPAELASEPIKPENTNMAELASAKPNELESANPAEPASAKPNELESANPAELASAKPNELESANPAESETVAEPIKPENANIAEPAVKSIEPVESKSANIAEPETVAEPIKSENANIAESSAKPIKPESANIAESSAKPIESESANIAEPSAKPNESESANIAESEPIEPKNTNISESAVESIKMEPKNTNISEPAVEPIEKKDTNIPEPEKTAKPIQPENANIPKPETTAKPIQPENADIPKPEAAVKDNTGQTNIPNSEDKAAAAVMAEVMDGIALEVDGAIGSTEPEITGLELCRRYYEEYGKPMIAEKFRAYESVIAVGLVGKGSDCFGFDDVQSRDHDFGPRFFLWVTKKVYGEIGEELQQAYEKLPTSFMGIDRIETFHGKDRGGVMVIEDFYKNILGYDLIGALLQSSGNGQLDKENLGTIKSWLAVHDYALAAAVNGAVFRDDEGVFTRYREKLMAYYPKAVWYRKIAQTCALFSQSGQYNLPRMRRRGQLVAAELAKAECARQAMKLYYLLNKKYAPHDKWLFKGMPDNAGMAVRDENGKIVQAAELVEKISLIPVDDAHEQELTMAVESLAVIFANELESRNMIGECSLYLDASTKELTAKSDALLTAIVADTPIITALSLSIAKAEFEAFDKVKNEGGRASCQNNWPTFKIMRMSQYMTWTEDMLLQYLYEFKTNYENGRNMIEEKYARMMESTAPLEYARFADKLPPISEDKKAVMEQIIGFQVKWMEEFAAAYPKLASNARAIHTSEDLPYDTSYETYLRGELGTYSDRMLEMYGRYIVGYAQSGKNAAFEVMKNTVRFYGYKDLETANQNGI